MKRIVTIQDISCFGKCSLTVALPIISAMGVEAAILPTAVLSTHTGGFKNFTFHDLSEDIPKIFAHWKRESIDFDAIYTGYLGSLEQIDQMKEFIDAKPKKTLAFVDPAMADNGVLYTGFTPEFARHMATLCAKADVIVPNITEASFMLGVEYKESGYDKEYVEDILKRLAALGAKKTVLTGVSFEEDKLGVAMYDSEKDEFFYYFNERLDCKFHGTGDVFASACVGALMNEKTLQEALKIAADYTVECIRLTIPDREKYWYGVEFERAIPFLLKSLDK
ncbi:MAG: pyridoxamine kinase [Firmicutes bacterium]|nr:pyridoxamine kinase [Bacillota bacterium]